jgi:c-di-GMP-related signal transduction protein
MTTTSTSARPSLVQRVSTLKSLPASQAILKPLLDLLRQPLDDVEIPKVVELVSYEKTIAAQLLRIANSPLYARSSTVDSIQNAVFTVGVQRIEDILLTHCFSKLVAKDKWVVYVFSGATPSAARLSARSSPRASVIPIPTRPISAASSTTLESLSIP